MAKFVSDENLLYVWQKVKSKLNEKVDKVDGKGLSSNDYTSTEKAKLAGIANNAQVNTLEGIQVNGSTITPTNKIANIDLSAYALKSQISAAYIFKGSITWANLIALTTAEVGHVYNVTDKGGANYACIVAKTAGENSWDKLGDTVDLSNYYTKSESENKFYHTISETVVDAEQFVDTNVTRTTTTITRGTNTLASHSIKSFQYGNATTSKAGLMTGADKVKLDSLVVVEELTNAEIDTIFNS